MTEKCFDEGTIQAFLDGELESDLLETVARHTAACRSCGLLLQEAEEESAFAFSALGEEFNSLVPTERIRTNLYDAIAQIERPRPSFWGRIFGTGFSFSNQSIVAFASLLLVVGLFTALFINRASQNPAGGGSGEIAQNNLPKATSVQGSKTGPAINQSVEPLGKQEAVNVAGNPADVQKVQRAVSKPAVENQPTFQKASYKIERPADEDRRPITGDNRPTKGDPRANSETLLAEESYVKTIATLSESVNSRKDNVLRPSEQVAFEKDLAVVNDAIAKMRREVRRNPKNEAAKRVLRSSYQNKIDLLNSVAERTELMALR